MDTVFFGGVGLFFVLLGLYLLKKHREFVSNCIKVEGKVTAVVEKIYKTRGSFGQIIERRRINVPVVVYRYHRLYRFNAELDADVHKLVTGARVEVLINPFKPKTAKLSIGAHQGVLVFRLMVGLGLFIASIGVYLFNPNEFSLDFLNDPFIIIMLVVLAVFFYLKLWPMLSLLPNMPIYTENAEEVKDSGNSASGY